MKLGSVVVTNIEIVIVVVTVVVAIALDVWVRRSRTGRAVRSIAFDPATSGLLGIDVNRLAALTMFVAGALAGLAGVLLAVYVGAEDTTTGQAYMLTAFAILIVGGVGSVRGAIAAAFFHRHRRDGGDRLRAVELEQRRRLPPDPARAAGPPRRTVRPQPLPKDVRR